MEYIMQQTKDIQHGMILKALFYESECIYSKGMYVFDV